MRWMFRKKAAINKHFLNNTNELNSNFQEEKLTTIIESPNIDKNNGKGSEESKSIPMNSESMLYELLGNSLSLL